MSLRSLHPAPLGLAALVLAGPAPTAAAQAPPGYYASVDDSNPVALRSTLHAVIDDHQRFPYTSGSTDTWDILKLADEDPANGSRILDLYKNASYQKVSGGGGSYNREHTWPNSYGFPDDGADNYAYTDCHQLFLCDIAYNGTRGSKPFGDGSGGWSELTTQANGGVGGAGGGFPGDSNWYSNGQDRFQVWSERKGDVARALLYMDVRYEGGTHGSTGVIEPDLVLTDDLSLVYASSTGNNESVAYMGRLSTLLQWHADDPVDAREVARNQVVFSYQGNRNPFVDHPEWVDCLFSASCGGGGDTTPPAAPSGLVATGAVAFTILDWADNTESDLAGYRVRRSLPGGAATELTTGLVLGSTTLAVGITGGATYAYEVAAEDASGNLSAWSSPATAAALPGACGAEVYDVGASPANLMTLAAGGLVSTGSTVTLEVVDSTVFGSFFGISAGKTNLPLLGGAVLVDPLTLLLPLQYAVSPTGYAAWPVPVPSDPSFAGLTVFAQAFALDPVQPGGYRLSNGLELEICP